MTSRPEAGDILQKYNYVIWKKARQYLSTLHYSWRFYTVTERRGGSSEPKDPPLDPPLGPVSVCLSVRLSQAGVLLKRVELVFGIQSILKVPLIPHRAAMELEYLVPNSELS